MGIFHDRAPRAWGFPSCVGFPGVPWNGAWTVVCPPWTTVGPAVGVQTQVRNTRAIFAGTRQTWSDCLMTIPLFLAAIPWGYVWRHYVRQPGDRWRSAR